MGHVTDMSEQEYRQKADVWPLNPNGELTNWTIVESKEGLAHVREIAAVKAYNGRIQGLVRLARSVEKERRRLEKETDNWLKLSGAITQLVHLTRT